MNPDQYDTYHPLWYKVEDEITKRFIGKIDAPVLDIGCGTGFAIELFDIHAKDYTGIDVDPAMLKRAINKYPKYKFIHADAKTYIPKACFKTVIFMFGSASYFAWEELLKILWTNLNYKEPSTAYFHLYGLGRDWSSPYARQTAGNVKMYNHDFFIADMPFEMEKVKINPWNRILRFVPDWAKIKLLNWNPQFFPSQYYAWTLYRCSRS